MPRNVQGLYTLPAGNPVSPGTVIESAWANTTMDDLAQAMTDSLPRNGSAPMTGDLTLANSLPSGPRHATSKAYVDQFMAYSSGMPVGGVMAIAGSSIPTGFLVCDGAAVSRTTYADLFASIGTIYGAGDSSTTFNVPDLRDWFIRGKSDSRPLGNKMAATLAAHTHPLSDPGHGHLVSQEAHNHSTGEHSHSINDPGHSHSYQRAISGGNQKPASSGTAPFDTYDTPQTGGVGTGISVVAVGDLGVSTVQPTVYLNTNTTGASIGATGGAETAPQNVAMIYVIKAVQDGTGSGTLMTEIDTNDYNMISVDNTNPVVPILEIHANVAFGTVKLDGSGKVPLAQMPTGTAQFMGFYDASANTLPVGVFSSGSYYTISVSGTLNVYDPVTLVSSPTVVQVNSHIQYVESLTNPDGWYYLVVTSDDFVAKTSATGSALLPYGTTAQRDPVPEFGAVRGNVDDTTLEWWNGTAWGPLGGGATGAPNNPFIYENDIHVTADYSITSGKNAMSAGPIIIDNGVSVTVPPGSTWSIV